MKIWVTYFCICVLLFVTTALTRPIRQVDSAALVAYVKQASQKLVADAQALEVAVRLIKPGNPATIARAKAALLQCRLQYKRIGFLMEYFFASEATAFNSPAKYEVDEPDMEYQHPKGFQQIEALLFSNNIAANKTALLQHVQLVEQSAEGLPALLYQFAPGNAQVLESARLELIRVMALYISGYDAPQLKSGIGESAASLEALRTVLTPLIEASTVKDSMYYYLNASIQYLQASPGFDGFNRLAFLTGYALPLQRQFNNMAGQLNLQLNTVPALNMYAGGLFSPGALQVDAFAGTDGMKDTSLTLLGKQLFLSNLLSANRLRSCASCHAPAGYFADGLRRNTVAGSTAPLPRNTPTLLYAAYQYSQFWDGRAKNMQQQAAMVIHNQQEMGITDDTAINRLKKAAFAGLFAKVWPAGDSAITMVHVYTALAAYIKTLAPFSSPFDRYMQGNTTALTTMQQTGFNLFMGKAACGTCHFAPLFNGLTPPLYHKTEYEIVGTPLTDDLARPRPDNDTGRYVFFPIEFYIKAFKTPTVRNAAVTAPYMHNGAFASLDKVVEFYNRGGGAGLGLKEAGQTLMPQPLHLTQYEKDCLVAFMQALTDDKASLQ
jgi:cytochrome c peroxidase